MLYLDWVLTLSVLLIYPLCIKPIVFIGKSTRKHSLKLIKDISKKRDKHLIALAQEDGSIENPNTKELYSFGTLVKVMRIFDMPDNSKSAIVQGIGRVKITKFYKNNEYYTASIEKIEEPIVDSSMSHEVDSKIKNLVTNFNKLIDLAPYLSEEQASTLSTIVEPGKIADRAVSFLNIQIKDKQNVLETIDISDRINKAIKLISKEIHRIELSQKISSDVQDEITKSQREYYLREQLKAIQKELGDDDPGVEFDELHEKIKKAKMPKNVLKIANKELKRMKKIPSHSPEYTVSRTYLDWLSDMPWSIESKDNNDVINAKEILDEDHFGLEKVKDRIIEHLAVRNLKKSRSKKGEVLKSPILCFGGPPGTGKTSIGKSIANAMGRKFVRISLGGVRDEAEIRGHRRTYIGALPGRIITSLKKAGTKNPIFMLDEIDKLGTDFRGDPSSALLEVLDPEQNFSFNDHYLEVDFDLSNIMFIATANTTDTIPAPLLDRMEVIRLPGYTENEKLEIAKKYLIPKQYNLNGLKQKELSIPVQTLRDIISFYTREAGVRNLDREINKICRKSVKSILLNKTKNLKILPTQIEDYLGVKRHTSMICDKKDMIGQANGLAWTSVGGEMLRVECVAMSGKGKVTQTGQLGDVMQESIKAGITVVKTR